MKTLEVLLVEDNPGDAFLVQETLEHSHSHIHVKVCQDGVEALSYLRQEDFYDHTPEPDLVLLDLDLPRKDGWSVLNEIKEDVRLKRIPVIIMTGSQVQQALQRSCFSLANDFLRKPEDWDHFQAFLDYLETNWLQRLDHRPHAGI
jgi:CheY-like chemotaxis protein